MLDAFFTAVKCCFKAAPIAVEAPVAVQVPVSEAQRALNKLLRGLNPDLKVELREIWNGLGFADRKVGEVIPHDMRDGDLCIQFSETFYWKNRRDCFRMIQIFKWSAPKAGFARAFMDEGENGCSYLRIVQ